MKQYHYFLRSLVLIIGLCLASSQVGYGQQYVNNKKYSDPNHGDTYPLANRTYNKVELSYKSSDFDYPPSKGYIVNVFIRFSVETVATFSNFKISMAQVPLSTFKDTTRFTKPLTVVYGPVKTSIDNEYEDWHNIILETPFLYDPAKVLIVVFEQDSILGFGGFWSYTAGETLPRYRIYGRSQDTLGKKADKEEYDFGFTLKTLVANDVEICDLVTPKYHCASAAYQDVVVNLCNLSYADVSSVNIGWSIDGILQTPIYCNPGPKYDSTMDVKLGNILISKGKNHILKAWTYLPSGMKNSVSNQDTLIMNDWLPDTLGPKITIEGKAFDSLQVAYPGYASSYYDQSVVYSDMVEARADLKLMVGGSFYDSFPNWKNVNKVGNYQILYTATDQCGNSSSKARQIKVYDHVPPDISLVGSTVASICRWSDYQDAGFIVSDNYYSSKDIKVDTFGTFVTHGHSTGPGNYFLRYRAIDGSGNEGLSASRTIYVLDSTSPVCTGKYPTAPVQVPATVLYPNPNHGIFTLAININDSNNYHVNLVNILGQAENITQHCTYSQYKLQVDASEPPSGLYFIKIISGSENVCLPVMICH